VSFIGLKQGLFTADGPDCCGTVVFEGLDVPAAIYGWQVLSARRDLAGARYAYLLAGLSLKAAVGSLSPADLAQIDQHLRPPAAAKSSSLLPGTATASVPGRARSGISDATPNVQAQGQRVRLKMAILAPTTPQQR
jgi:hypothetical protein